MAMVVSSGRGPVPPVPLVPPATPLEPPWPLPPWPLPAWPLPAWPLPAWPLPPTPSMPPAGLPPAAPAALLPPPFVWPAPPAFTEPPLADPPLADPPLADPAVVEPPVWPLPLVTATAPAAPPLAPSCGPDSLGAEQWRSSSQAGKVERRRSEIGRFMMYRNAAARDFDLRKRTIRARSRRSAAQLTSSSKREAPRNHRCCPVFVLPDIQELKRITFAARGMPVIIPHHSPSPVLIGAASAPVSCRQVSSIPAPPAPAMLRALVLYSRFASP